MDSLALQTVRGKYRARLGGRDILADSLDNERAQHLARCVKCLLERGDLLLSLRKLYPAKPRLGVLLALALGGALNLVAELHLLGGALGYKLGISADKLANILDCRPYAVLGNSRHEMKPHFVNKGCGDCGLGGGISRLGKDLGRGLDLRRFFHTSTPYQSLDYLQASSCYLCKPYVSSISRAISSRLGSSSSWRRCIWGKKSAATSAPSITKNAIKNTFVSASVNSKWP